MIVPVLLTAVGALLIVSAVYDAMTLTIPNWLSLALVALFPLAAWAGGLGLAATGVHVAIGMTALLAGMALFALNLVGGGDAKFFAAVSLYAGFSSYAMFTLVVVLAGAALAVIIVGARQLEGFGVPMAWFLKFTRGGSVIPYGIAIAAGGLAVLPETQIFAGHFS